MHQCVNVPVEKLIENINLASFTMRLIPCDLCHATHTLRSIQCDLYYANFVTPPLRDDLYHAIDTMRHTLRLLPCNLHQRLIPCDLHHATNIMRLIPYDLYNTIPYNTKKV